MRKWSDPPSPPEMSPLDERSSSETVRHRARAFRLWLARGADPGGLRALAGERPEDDDERARREQRP